MYAKALNFEIQELVFVLRIFLRVPEEQEPADRKECWQGHRKYLLTVCLVDTQRPLTRRLRGGGVVNQRLVRTSQRQYS